MKQHKHHENHAVPSVHDQAVKMLGSLSIGAGEASHSQNPFSIESITPERPYFSFEHLVAVGTSDLPEIPLKVASAAFINLLHGDDVINTGSGRYYNSLPKIGKNRIGLGLEARKTVGIPLNNKSFAGLKRGTPEWYITRWTQVHPDQSLYAINGNDFLDLWESNKEQAQNIVKAASMPLLQRFYDEVRFQLRVE